MICASCHGSTLPSQTFRTTLVCPTGVLCLHSSATRLMTLRSWVSVTGTSCGSWTEGNGRINGGGRRMQVEKRVTCLARTLEHTSDTQLYCSQSSLYTMVATPVCCVVLLLYCYSCSLVLVVVYCYCLLLLFIVIVCCCKLLLPTWELVEFDYNDLSSL